jgi:hypothetical protein
VIDFRPRVRSLHYSNLPRLLEGPAPALLAVLLLAPLAEAAPQLGAAGAPSLGDLFRPVEGKVHRLSSTSLDPSSNVDYIPLASGAEIALADIKGAGVIRHLWLTVESDDPYYARLMVLRAKWDGEATPSIEVPIGDFFGVGHGLEAEVNTLPVRVAGDGRARSSFWPMPFNQSADITLRNDSSRPARLVFWQVDWAELGEKSAGMRTLHAHFRASAREKTLRQHRVAEIVGGPGHYVGTVLSIWSGEEGWPGEGDDRFFLDGETTPTLVGTGLEGYFDDAWGLRVGTGPYGGVTVYEGTGAGARLTACRWHIVDPIPFEKGLSLTFERAGWAKRDGAWKLAKDRDDAFSSVAFWYQVEPHGPLSILPPQNERLPFFEVRIEPEDKETLKALVFPDEVPPPTRVEGPFLAYGAQIVFAPRKVEEGRLAFPFDVPGPRDYDLYVRLTKGPDSGVWQLLVDGEPISAPIDLYSPRPIAKELLLGRRNLKPTGHSVEFRCTGKNLESTGFALGVDSFMARYYP